MNANCLGLCRPSVFRRNVFSEMTVVAQSSVAQKIIRPYVFRQTVFSPNRLHPIQGRLSSRAGALRTCLMVNPALRRMRWTRGGEWTEWGWPYQSGRRL